MGGHLEIGDAEKIKEARTLDAYKIKDARTRERVEAMEARRQDRGKTFWPDACPTCFAEPGERCITRNGKRAMRHKNRGEVD